MPHHPPPAGGSPPDQLQSPHKPCEFSRPLAPGAHGQAVPEAKVDAGPVLQETRLGADLGVQPHAHCARRRRANHQAHAQALQRNGAAGAGAAARGARKQQQRGAEEEAWGRGEGRRVGRGLRANLGTQASRRLNQSILGAP